MPTHESTESQVDGGNALADVVRVIARQCFRQRGSARHERAERMPIGGDRAAERSVANEAGFVGGDAICLGELHGVDGVWDARKKAW